MSDTQRATWNERYEGVPLVWGAEPNRFVAEAYADRPAAGRVLDLGCGEGRNAIWLARRGWRVTAIDLSDVAIERARSRAEREELEIEWIRADIAEFESEAQAFAVVLIAYLHLPAAERREALRLAASALAPGGELFLIGHARRNLEEGVGGPPDASVLYDATEIGAELRELGLRVERCEEVLRAVDGEQGRRQAIDLLVRARSSGGE